jgi:LemA protein
VSPLAPAQGTLVWLLPLALALGAGLVARSAVVERARLLALRQGTERRWSEVARLLAQRQHELPSLLAVVRGYVHRERRVLVRVEAEHARTESLTRAGAPRRELAHAAGVLGAAVARLLEAAARYPEVKADPAFQRLAARLTTLESQLAERRRAYNHRVDLYNGRLARGLARLLASFVELEPLARFEAVDAATLDDVELGLPQEDARPRAGTSTPASP